MHVGAIGHALFLFDFTFHWGLGWRYLLSRGFRRRVQSEWKTRSRASVAGGIVVALVAFLVVNGFLALVAIWLYCGIVVPRLTH